MNRSTKSSHDKAVIATVFVPITALLVFFASAGAKWRSESLQIRPLLQRTLSDELIDAPSPIAVDYAARTDSAESKELRELIYAAVQLNRKYDALSAILSEAPYSHLEHDQPGRIDTHLKAYLREAAPLLDRLDQIDGDLHQIWLPNELGNPNYWSQDQSYLIHLVEMQFINFFDAVRSGDGDRALDAYECGERTSSSRWESQYEIAPWIPWVVAQELWDEPQLKRLDRMVASIDLEGRWQAELYDDIVTQTPTLLSGRPPRDHWSDAQNVVIAPSRRVEWLRRFNAYSDIQQIGTRRSDERALDIRSESTQASQGRLDLSLQFPSYTGRFGDHDAAAARTRRSVKDRNWQRFTRTAIAIAEYKLEFDAYPDSLRDLVKVGYPIDQAQDPLGRSFSYEPTEQGYRLGNASMRFPTQPGSIRSTVSPEMILATYLQHYREIWFE